MTKGRKHCAARSTPVQARYDPHIEARIARRLTLRYTGPGLGDRPPHVRASSGLSMLAGRIAVIQDDASFVALVDPGTGKVNSLPLPPGPGGRRVFDGESGKRSKLDLEACATVHQRDSEVLIALGSGSTSARETVVVVEVLHDGGPATARRVEAGELYAALRACHELSGSELNIEGAVVLDTGALRLFQRGNGAPREGLMPVNATGDVDLGALLWYLDHVAVRQPPAVENVVQYDLGLIGDVPLTFTDAAVAPGGSIVYVASAERSPDTYRDGDVTGAAVGVISGESARWARLCDEPGRPVADKAEGVVLDPNDGGRAYLCVDPDDPRRPGELLEVSLTGPWW